MSDEGVCTVTHDPEVPCVVMLWQGYATSAQFRAANERVLAVVKETKAQKLLGDVSRFVLIGSEDQAWLNQNWIPRAVSTSNLLLGSNPIRRYASWTTMPSARSRTIRRCPAS